MRALLVQVAEREDELRRPELEQVARLGERLVGSAQERPDRHRVHILVEEKARVGPALARGPVLASVKRSALRERDSNCQLVGVADSGLLGGGHVDGVAFPVDLQAASA